MSKLDLTGEKFGKLTVIRKDTTPLNAKNSKWLCKCDCGNETSVFRHSLLKGKTISCGCSRYGNTNAKTHGLSKTRIYGIWSKMRGRCYNANLKDFKTYQSCGITVCEEWNNNFFAFYEWSIENGYSENLTIDRIDNTKGYCPENCRWITNAEQQLNKRNTVKVFYNNQEIALVELCRQLNLSYKKVHRKYKELKDKNIDFDINEILH